MFLFLWFKIAGVKIMNGEKLYGLDLFSGIGGITIIVRQIREGVGRDYHEDDDFYMYHVDLNIRKPLRLKENRLGSWSASSLLVAVFDAGLPQVTDVMEDDFEDGVLKVEG